MPSIIIVSGPNEGDYYPLGRRPMVVGRDQGCPIQVVDELVSRRQVQIRMDEKTKTYHALDMKSVNGVLVNGRQIQNETALVDGDIIEVGKSKLLFTLADFVDRESAMNHWRGRGESSKSTLIR